MKDLHLFRKLLVEEERPLDPSVVGPLLDELAALPMEQRFPFYGVLGRALEHEDAGVAAAAVKALRGAEGPYGLRRIVAALSDRRPPVALAAVEALRESSAGQPARWIHAVFHPEAAVRVAAAGGAAPPQTEELFAVYLLADPAAHELVLARLSGRTRGESNGAAKSDGALDDAPIATATHMLPAALELAESGAIPRDVARRLLAGIAWNEAARWMERSTKRTDEEVRALLDSVDKPEGPDAALLEGARDGFDFIFDRFWEGPDDPSANAVPASSSRSFIAFWSRLGTALQAWKPELVRRAVASILRASALYRLTPRAAAGLCAVFHPRFLGAAWVPRGVRHGAVASLYAFGAHTPRLPDDDVRALIAGDLARRPSGKLDLWVIGGLLHFVKNHPYKRLLRWVKLDEVLGAFADDAELSAPLLCLRDESKLGRDYLIARIDERCHLPRGLLRALLALAAPADELDFLRSIAPDEAAGTAAELVRVLMRPGSRLSLKKSSILGQILGETIARGAAPDFLRAWLATPVPEEIAFGLSTLGAIGVAMEAEPFVEAALALDLPLLQKLMAAMPHCHGLPFGKELALARALAAHEDEAIRAWCSARLPIEENPTPPAARRGPDLEDSAPLSDAEREEIHLCSEADLAKALAPCLAEPRRGVARALAQRRPPASPSLAACAALLGAHDDIEEVSAEFGRFGSREAAFLTKLDAQVVRTWERTPRLPLLGHAWLHKWERHAFAFVEALEIEASSLAEGLRWAAALSEPVLREQVWEAAASVLAMWRWRKKVSELLRVTSDALLDLLIAALAGDLGEPAARALMAIVEAHVAPENVEVRKPSVAELLPDLTAEVRHTLAPWIASKGLIQRSAPRKRAEGDTDEETIRKIRGTSDFDALEAWCLSATARIVEEASLRLLELGEPGAERLLRVLQRTPPAAGARIIVETVPMWPEGDSLRAARGIAEGIVAAPPELRFHLSLALVAAGYKSFLERAIEAARADAQEAWFRPEDWARLLNADVPEFDLALALAASPHPHAYRRAVGLLLDAPEARASDADSGLRAFLEAGSERSSDLRRKAAWRLRDRGDFIGLPVLLQDALDAREVSKYAVLAGAPAELVIASVTAVLTAGTRKIPESFALSLLDAPGVDPQAQADASELLLADARLEAIRAAVVRRVVRGPQRAAKLRSVAETFAWGVRIGRELTGRVFTVRMIGGSELGYTRFDANHIFVTPLPILRREPHGRTIVEGLILHELGHHMYHRGEVPKAAWDAAQKEGIFGLLNLVADEHLERNLRALSPEYGDRLKKLAAYAFQHTTKEIPVAELCAALGGHAFGVLTQARLEVARRDDCARVHSGPLLLGLERAGRSFPRFMRALRMGLGNRHNDPLVDAALELFKGNHKRRSMQELLDVARKLRDIFGWQASIVESFGTHEAMPSDRAEEITHGEGITAEELEAEIERVLDPKSRLDRRDEGSPGGRRWINVSPDERFTTISTVVKVPFDPAAHARGAASVARHARQMRRYLEELGLSMVIERRRLAGRRFDTTRTLAVVLRGDPRMLVARRVQRSTDLFLGVLIDCSGSMQSHDNIEKAKLFGAMLAEAVRDLRGVTLALFGFTHEVIFDAGDAARCAVHGLEAEGGNNDAGALWYAAGVARASRRRAKLLVMISDGLPTECSAEALRSLVSRLHNREGIACAQVAVQPLTEVCFPHYVVLGEADPDAAVRRFGSVVASLVQKTLAGA